MKRAGPRKLCVAPVALGRFTPPGLQPSRREPGLTGRLGAEGQHNDGQKTEKRAKAQDGIKKEHGRTLNHQEMPRLRAQ